MTKEEGLQWLGNLVDRINTQDNRATRKPYFVELREKVLQYTCGCYGGAGYYRHRDGDFEAPIIKGRNKTEAIANLIQGGYYESEDAPTEEDLEELGCIEHDRVVGTFFTYEGLKRHLDLNGHNYRRYETFDYVEYANRNPEMEELFQALCAVTGKEIK
jgi:hypothetical protein